MTVTEEIKLTVTEEILLTATEEIILTVTEELLIKTQVLTDTLDNVISLLFCFTDAV